MFSLTNFNQVWQTKRGNVILVLCLGEDIVAVTKQQRRNVVSLLA